MDAIVIATHGWSGADWWSVGGVSEEVLRYATVPVCLIRPTGGPRPRRNIVAPHVLVPLDGSPLAEHAVAYAEQLVRRDEASLLLLHVASPGSEEAAIQAVIERLQAIAGRLGKAGLNVRVATASGRPGPEICQAAEDNAVDIVVLSSHGQDRYRRRRRAWQRGRTGAPWLSHSRNGAAGARPR
jgi:nucleotide-binding universal stress UspA family protein